MARIRRTRYLFFLCDDEPALDISLLLRGVAARRRHGFRAFSILTGRHVPVERPDLELVVSLPWDDWVEPDGDGERLRALARAGVLVSDSDEPELAELRRRDEELAATDWNLYGAAYHFLTRWSNVDLRQASNGEPLEELPPLTADTVRGFFAFRGPPPPAFPSVSPAARDLPLVAREGGLYDLLLARRTVRSFDDERPPTLEELAIVLRYVFGCHGYASALGHVVALKKTSPSGGALHPIEVYPVVRSVDGLEPGLYHYAAGDHALEPIAPLSAAEARALAADFVCGQTFFADAHVLFVLAARFERSHWKYRRHQKAYAVTLLDAGHLSQTLQLVATELGLGAFVTAAVNGADIERRLGLDGVREGVVAVCGCGRPARKASPFDASFRPFAPRETPLVDGSAE